MRSFIVLKVPNTVTFVQNMTSNVVSWKTISELNIENIVYKFSMVRFNMVFQPTVFVVALCTKFAQFRVNIKVLSVKLIIILEVHASIIGVFSVT